MYLVSYLCTHKHEHLDQCKTSEIFKSILRSYNLAMKSIGDAMKNSGKRVSDQICSVALVRKIDVLGLCGKKGQLGGN